MENYYFTYKIMSAILFDHNITVQIVENHQEIIKYLYLSASIPIWNEFQEYIYYNLEFYKAKSIIALDNGNFLGHVLIYTDNSDVLFFGFFWVRGSSRKVVTLLINEIVNYANNKKFSYIRGPINIPTYIYGWGFLKEGSDKNLYLGKPINSSIYQDLFLKEDFYVKFVENTWEGLFIPFNPRDLPMYDFSNYEFFYPENYEELMELKEIFLELHLKYLPASAQITPSKEGVVDDFFKFAFKYGGLEMFFFVMYLTTNEIIACGSNLINPFRRNSYGDYDSFINYSHVIVPEHRYKYINGWGKCNNGL